MSMEVIGVEPGKLVIVTRESISNGREDDKEKARRFLEVGKTYEITLISVSSWSSLVQVKEVPGETFNSVLFDDL